MSTFAKRTMINDARSGSLSSSSMVTLSTTTVVSSASKVVGWRLSSSLRRVRLRKGATHDLFMVWNV